MISTNTCSSCGCYTLIIDGERIPVRAVQEYFIPKGLRHGGEPVADTRTIHAFGGHRADRTYRECVVMCRGNRTRRQPYPSHFLRVAPTTLSRPVPTRSSDAGSGVGAVEAGIVKSKVALSSAVRSPSPAFTLD